MLQLGNVEKLMDELVLFFFEVIQVNDVEK